MRFTSSTLAQDEAEAFIPKTYPNPPYATPTPTRYNLKFGSLEARISGSIQAEYNDNINLSAKNQQSDFSFGPDVRVGFIYPINEVQLLQLNLGFGYRWYLNHPALASFALAPDSRLDYRLTIHKTLSLNFSDSFQIQSDPTSVPTLSGSPGGSGLLDFRRIVNLAGILARWQANEKIGLVAGYNWTYDRSLTPQFTSIDSDTYAFNAGAFYSLNPKVTLGVMGGYSFTDYRLNQQNNGEGYYFGPNLNFKATKSITMDASVYYAVNSFGQNGALNGGVSDTSGFVGVTYQASIRHHLNKWFSHGIRLSHGTENGLGSNFTETTALQYDATTHIFRSLSLNSTFSYQRYAASGTGGETGDLYLLYLGTNYQLARRWGLGASYVLAWKEASNSDHNYAQNRITAQLTHEF